MTTLAIPTARPLLPARLALLLFFGLTFLLSWTVWGINIAQARGLTSWHAPGLLAFSAIPTAAVLSALLTGGRPALADLLGRLLRWRVGARWYAAALFGFLPLGLLAAALLALTGGTPRLGLDLTLSAAPLYLLRELPFMWLTEELGWRGFALPRLLSALRPAPASLLLGLLWGLWHLPLFFLPGEAQAGWSYAAFLALILPVSLLFTALYRRTRGSVLLAALLHTGFDGAFLLTGLGASPAAMWLFAALLWALAGWLTLRGGLRASADG